MTEFGITEEDLERIEDAIENGMGQLNRGRASRRRSSTVGRAEVLESIREMEHKGFREVSSRGIARYMDNRMRPSYVGKIMSSLAADGYVDRIGEESPYRWNLSVLKENPRDT